MKSMNGTFSSHSWHVMNSFFASYFLIRHPKDRVRQPAAEGVVVLELFEEMGVVFEQRCESHAAGNPPNPIQATRATITHMPHTRRIAPTP
jgi:hypothetical protein